MQSSESAKPGESSPTQCDMNRKAKHDFVKVTKKFHNANKKNKTNPPPGGAETR